MTQKDKPGDAFSAPPGLTASSKMGRTGECAPPSRRLQHDLMLTRRASAGPAQLSSRSVVRPSCLQCREHQEADSYSFTDEFAQFAPEREPAASLIVMPGVA